MSMCFKIRVMLVEVFSKLSQVKEVSLYDRFIILQFQLPVVSVKRWIIKTMFWTKPKAVKVKLNVHSCSMGNLKNYGSGGIVRNDLGKPLVAFSSFYG